MLLFKLCNETLEVCLRQCQAVSKQTILAKMAGALLVCIAMKLQSVAACWQPGLILGQLSEERCLENAEEDRLRISRLVQSDGQLTLTSRMMLLAQHLLWQASS